jgi:DNA-binding FrmR family transcriptional regulator
MGVYYTDPGRNPQGYLFPNPRERPAQEDDVDLPEDVMDDLHKRLRRIAGQVQGIERMLDEGRECRDIVTQISAANRALEQAGFRLVSAGLKYCLADPDAAAADGYPIGEVEKMFMRLA